MTGTWFSFNNSTLVVTVGQTSDVTKIGTYNYQIKGYITGYSTRADYASVTITILSNSVNTGPPVYSTPLKDLTLNLGQTLAYSFPKLKDPDATDTPQLVSIDLGLAKSFITGKYGSYVIKPTS